MKKKRTLKEILLKMIEKENFRKQICETLLSEVAKGNLKAVDLIRDIMGEKNAPSVEAEDRVEHIVLEVVDAKEGEN